MPTTYIEGALALPSWRWARWWASTEVRWWWWWWWRGGYFFFSVLKGGRIERQGVQRSESGGPWNSERRRREEVLKGTRYRPPRKKPGRIALRQCALPASRRMGIFFSIHPPRPLFPSSLSQTSQSVCQCAASIRASQSSGGIVRRRDGRDNEWFFPPLDWESKRCATSDRRQFPAGTDAHKSHVIFFITSQVSRWPLCQSGDAFLALWLVSPSSWTYLDFLKICTEGFTDLQPEPVLQRRIAMRIDWAHRASTCLYEDGAVDTSDIFFVLKPAQFFFCLIFSS